MRRPNPSPRLFAGRGWVRGLGDWPVRRRKLAPRRTFTSTPVPMPGTPPAFLTSGASCCVRFLDVVGHDHDDDFPKPSTLNSRGVNVSSSLAQRADVIWECDYPSTEARAADIRTLGASLEWKGVETHMDSLIRKFQRMVFEATAAAVSP